MHCLRRAVPERLHRKMCLSCGYDGRLLQSALPPHAYACPRCGADLYARPPRAYAELEGFDQADRTPALDRLSRLLASAPNVTGLHRQRSRAQMRRTVALAGVIGVTIAAAATAAAFGLI